MKSDIIILRHGITECNKRRAYYGRSDIPVIEEGTRDILEMKSLGYYPDVEDDCLFVTTGLLRTRQTQKLIYGTDTSEVIENLQEWNCGDFEQKTYQELLEIPECSEWFDNYTNDLPVPGGESMTMFYERIKSGFAELVDMHMKHSSSQTVAVLHGGVICGIMSITFGNGLDDEYWSWSVDPGRGYVLHMENNSVAGYDKL